MKPAFLLITLFVLTSCSSKNERRNRPSATAIKLNDSAAAFMMRLKQGNRQQGNLDSALILLDKAIAIDQDYFIAYSNKVAVYCRQGNFSKAAETAKQLERIQPQNPEAIFELGFLLEKTGKVKEAREKYQKALSLNKKKLKELDSQNKQYLSIQINYALNLIFSNKEDEGKRELNDVLKKDPNNLPAKILYGQTRTEILQQLISKN